MKTKTKNTVPNYTLPDVSVPGDLRVNWPNRSEKMRQGPLITHTFDMTLTWAERFRALFKGKAKYRVVCVDGRLVSGYH